MSRLVTIDLDSFADKAKAVAEEAPNLIPLLQAAGWTGAGAIGNYMPLAGPIMNLLSKLAGNNDGLTVNGMPNLGPRGKGRMSYLRTYKSYSDTDVVRACETVIGGGFQQSKSIADTVNYTLRVMFPDTAKDQWDDSQTRKAIDRVLEEDIMPEQTCDKLGDMIFYALNSKRPSLTDGKTGE